MPLVSWLQSNTIQVHPDRVRVIVLACVVLQREREVLVLLGTWRMRWSPVTWRMVVMVMDMIGTV